MNKISTFLSTLFAFFGLIAGANAQCAAGEVAVTAEVTTDNWGYEFYWEITPQGDDCGVNTILSFGNVTVGCLGGGAQTAGPDASAYDDNVTTTEDLGCMTEGVCVTIHTVDDWGDGGSSIQFYSNGIASDLVEVSGTGGSASFCPTTPPSHDASVVEGPGREYTIVPLSQITPIGGSATIVNSGGFDITNATVTSTVTDGAGNVVYTETSAPVASIAVGSSENVSVAGYTPTMVDVYTIEYSVSIAEADGDAGNDVVQTSFIVSDSVYARDNGVAEGSLGIGSGDPGQLGQSFSVTALDTMTSVSMQISNASGNMTDKPISATIYDTDPVTGEPLNVIGTTEEVIVSATPDSMYTCVITNGLGLAPGTYVVVANETDENITLATSSSIYTAGATWVIFGGNPWANSEDYNFNVAYLLRPNFGSSEEQVDTSNVTFNVDMSLYTDPFTTVYLSGQFNNWCGDCNPMTDAGSGVWNVTIPMTVGDVTEYKFQLDEWAVAEEFVGGESCTVTDPSGQFINRVLTVEAGDPNLDVVCFASCEPCAVGIDENIVNNVSIYPNPSSGNFNLNISNVNTASVDVEITDVSGKVITSNVYNTVNGSVNESINISNVDDGIYIIRVNGGQSIVERIVISNK